jgi:hypothetical protein
MLDDIKQQLAAYLERVQQPFEMVATLGDDAKSRRDARAAADHPSMRPTRSRCAPTAATRACPRSPWRAGQRHAAALRRHPLGHEFTSLILALLWTGGHPPKVEAEVLEQIKALDVRPGLRGLHEPVLPQLPGRGAGAVAHGHLQPAHQDHHHRWRHVPGRIERARDHGRARSS